MSTVNATQLNQLLAEMQRLSAGAQSTDAAAAAAPQEGFADLLRASMNKVNEAQGSATEMAAAFERGDAATSLPEVMMALQKASLSFQAMTEVRNQLVNAYQEIMNMPV
jgi:flagellar hook-basal body complex protein FliE